MAIITNPRAGVSPYQVSAAAEPTVLRADATGATVTVTPTTATSTAAGDTSVIVNGQAALNQLITTSRTGVFEGANVTINLEEQQFNTTNQVTSTTNYPSGGAGEIQFNSGANSFASNAYFTYDNSNVITPGIRTDGYFYSNGAPFIGGGNAAIGNFVFTGDNMTISHANSTLSVTGNGTGNVNVSANSKTWIFGASGNLTLPSNTSSINYANGNPYGGNANIGNFVFNGNTMTLGVNQNLNILGNGTGNIQVTTDRNINLTANSNTWLFGAGGNLTLPGNTFAVNYANGNPVVISGGATLPLANGTSNIDIATANGNVTITANGSPTWTFKSDGNLSLPTAGNIVGAVNIIGNGTGNVNVIANGRSWGFEADGNLVLPLAGNIVNNGNTWNFGYNGTTQFPGNLLHPPTGNPLDIQVTVGNAYSTVSLYETGSQLIIQDNTTGPNPAWALFEADLANVNTPQAVVILKPGDTGTEVRWTFNADGNTVFPTLSVQRGDNPSGTITGQTLLFGDYTQEAIISTPDGNEFGYANSQRLVINPGAGAANSSGEGGDIYLWAGRGGNASGSGGDIKIRGGSGGDGTAGGNGGDGGYIRIEAGDGYTTNTPGGVAGFVEMTAGVGGENRQGGYVRITAGQGGNEVDTVGGGDANIQGGYGRNYGRGGNVNLIGGIAANGLAYYGNVNINAGASTWTFNNEGNLTTPGSSGNITGANVISANVFTAPGNVTVTANAYSWIFESNGNLTFPTGMHIDDESANTRISQNSGFLKMTAGNTAALSLGWSETETPGTGNIALLIANGGGSGYPGNLVMRTGNQESQTFEWTFDKSGNLTLPGSLVLSPDTIITGVGASPAPSINGFDTINAITFSASGNITGNNLFGNIYPQTGAILWVDVNRTDTYTPNGTINKPYKSIQDALDDATANTTISVAPGLYSENIVMPDLNGICIAGSSEMNTTIVNAAPGHTIYWNPASSVGNSITKFCLTNLDITNSDTTGTYQTLRIDAANVVYPDTFIGEEMDIQTVDFEGQQSQSNSTVYLNNVGVQLFWHSQIYGGSLDVINPGVFRATSMVIGDTADPHDFNVTYDGNLPRNGLGRNDITLAAGSAVFGNVNLNGHPIYQEDVDTVIIGNLNGANLSTFYASGRDYAPTILAYGQHGVIGRPGGSIVLTFPDPQASGSAFNFVDFSNGHILGVVNLTKANLSPVSLRGYAIVQGQAQFDTTTANGISANGYVAVDLRGANFNQSVLQATGAASIDRSTVTILAKSATTVGNLVAITPPLPTGATYATSVTPNSQSTVWVTGKTVANLTVTASANTTVDITLTRNT